MAQGRVAGRAAVRAQTACKTGIPLQTRVFLFFITPQHTSQGGHKASWVWDMGTAVCPHIRSRKKKAARKATNEKQTPAIQTQATMKISPPTFQITPLLQRQVLFYILLPPPPRSCPSAGRAPEIAASSHSILDTNHLYSARRALTWRAILPDLFQLISSQS